MTEELYTGGNYLFLEKEDKQLIVDALTKTIDASNPRVLELLTMISNPRTEIILDEVMVVG